MINTTRWKPDTCDCVIEYTWDSEQPEETREHTTKTVIACAAHQASGSKEEIHAQVTSECQQKNYVLGALADNHPELAVETTNEKGEVTRIPNLEAVAYSFDEDRNLKIELKGEAANLDKAALQATIANTEFADAGVVIV